MAYADIEKKRAYDRAYAAKNRDRINAVQRAWYTKRRELVAEQRRRFREAHPERIPRFSREYRARIRKQVFDHYGRVCVCCGETAEEFLTIDHVNGDGAAQRKSGAWSPGGGSLARLVIKQGFPSTYRVLCWNCNCARGRYGYCPHERQVKAGGHE